MWSLDTFTLPRFPVAAVDKREPDKLTRLPAVIISLMLLLMGAICFGLSYNHLTALALMVGMDKTSAMVWPLCLDAFMIIAAFYTIARKSQGFDPMCARLGVIGLTVLSMGFNAYVVPCTPIAILAAILPPGFLYFTFEMVLNILDFESMFKVRDPEPSPVRDMVAEVTESVSPVVISNNHHDPIRAYVERHPDTTISQIARDLGIPRTTMSRRLKQMGIVCMTQMR